MFVTVPAPHTFHIVHSDAADLVTELEHVGESKVRINAGFFVLRQEIFDDMEPGDELVLQPFERLIDRGDLLALPLRRLLAQHGHVQGQDRARRPWRPSPIRPGRSGTIDDPVIEDRRPHVTPSINS